MLYLIFILIRLTPATCTLPVFAFYQEGTSCLPLEHILINKYKEMGFAELWYPQ